MCPVLQYSLPDVLGYIVFSHCSKSIISGGHMVGEGYLSRFFLHFMHNILFSKQDKNEVFFIFPFFSNYLSAQIAFLKLLFHFPLVLLPQLPIKNRPETGDYEIGNKKGRG